ncbi:uncharacterized protein LODBEIA_P13120 [Lodderomyces beijingensis]|uniref:RNA exonuclease 4 n=1 Tax=Lodderomyces beijingensis TaxID=1775926 RepID=A0ABP0ZFZ0_9ASCO
MNNYSSNWKKLSSKIGKKSPSTEKKTKNEKNLIRKRIDQHKAQLIEKVSRSSNNNDDDTGTSVSVLEYTLWTKEDNDPISKHDLIRNAAKPRVLRKSPDCRRAKAGKYIAMDCEFVGVGPQGATSVLARVTIVNFYGHVLLDEYVRPTERVTDFRSWVSGVHPWHLKNAMSFAEAQEKASSLMKGRIVVGHALSNDLDKLKLSHPWSMVRDTSCVPEFRASVGGKKPSLKTLVRFYLGIGIQEAEHNPVEDARATMLLFRSRRKEIEKVTKE